MGLQTLLITVSGKGYINREVLLKTMPDKVFLTETRRNVLNGEYEGNDDSLTVEKSRIRTRARTALEELIELARSDEIDNSEVFEIHELNALLRGLMGCDLTPRHEMDVDDETYREIHRYQFRVLEELAGQVRAFDDVMKEEKKTWGLQEGDE